MHCPKCGQAIIRDDLRFCPQCGFQLMGLAQLIKADGDLPTLSDAIANKIRLTRRDGVKLSVLWFIFFTLFITPIIAVLGGDEIVAVTAVIGTMGSMLIAALSLMFLPKSGRPVLGERFSFNRGPKAIHTTSAPALPKADLSAPITYTPPSKGDWRNVEYSKPGSVTEGTTKLLKDELE